MPAPIWPARLLALPPLFPCSLSELQPRASGESEQKMYSFSPLSICNPWDGRLCLSYLVAAIWIFLCLPNDMMGWAFLSGKMISMGDDGCKIVVAE
jgi:hypothetical protein